MKKTFNVLILFWINVIFLEFQRPIPKKTISKTSNPSQNKSKLQESVKVSDKPEITKKRNIEELFSSSDSSTKLVVLVFFF